jgi:alkylation response protein AidB-like acyl-CoA dehydrogenase
MEAVLTSSIQSESPSATDKSDAQTLKLSEGWRDLFQEVLEKRNIANAVRTIRSRSFQSLLDVLSIDTDRSSVAVGFVGSASEPSASDSKTIIVPVVDGMNASHLVLIDRNLKDHPTCTVIACDDDRLTRVEIAEIGAQDYGLARFVLPSSLNNGVASDQIRLALSAALHDYTVMVSHFLVMTCADAIQTAGTYAANRRSAAGDYLTHQMLRHQLSTFEAQLEVANAAVRRLSEDLETDSVDGEEAAMNVLELVVHTSRVIIDGCLQTLGGAGFMAASWIANAFSHLTALPSFLATELMSSHSSETISLRRRQDDQVKNFAQEVTTFLDNEIAPRCKAWESNGVLPREMFQEFGRQKFFGAVVPTKLGGNGTDLRYSVALIEQMMRRRMTSVAFSTILTANTVCPLLARFASETCRERFLPGLLTGTSIGSLAVTEPGGSSNLGDQLQCTAIDDGKDWVVSGEKIYITNAPLADVIIALVRTDKNAGGLDLSLVAVPTVYDGVSIVEHHAKIGDHASPTGRIKFDQCRVPKEFTVGKIGHGFRYFTEVITEERLLISVAAINFSQSCLEEVIQSGGLNRAGASERVRRIWTELEACRILCDNIIELRLRGDRVTTWGWLAKFWVCEVAKRAMEICSDLMHDPLHRGSIDTALRDSRVFTIFTGPSDVMRDLYSKRQAARFRAHNALTPNADREYTTRLSAMIAG